MAWFFVVLIFVFSCLLLSWLSSRLVKSLINVGKYLQWREFVITFFIMAFATSLPNFFVDFNAVYRNLPEIAFGDIIGGNLVDLTLVLAIAVFFTKKGLPAESQMVQRSAIFTSVIAIAPLFLIGDGRLGRVDGLILILAFCLYAWWIFSEKSRFRKTYNQSKKENPITDFKGFILNVGKIIFLLILLLASSFAVVNSARFFADNLGISLSLVGILIVGLGNSFPEMYFAIISARKKENWMVLGELMGSVIICSTLVLGLVSLTFPIHIENLTPFLSARIFLIVAALLSLLFIRSDKKIVKQEGLLLLLIYIVFLLTEIFIV